MPHVIDSILRLQSIVDVLDHALAGEFPYHEPFMALTALRTCAVDNLKDLREAATLSADERENTSARADQVARDMSFLIGFLIRSTNVRNAFEWVWPFQDMCAKLFDGNGKRVVLSSEWNFVPFITTVAPFSNIPALSKFAFIGLPASESKNPLIIPAAAHEIGHSLWQSGGNPDEIDRIVWSTILDVKKDFKFDFNLEQVSFDVQKQLQESFCDLIGVGLFGVSYLYAFSYFCPSAGRKIAGKLVRDPDYPSNATRAQQMVSFCRDAGYKAPDGYLERYDDPRITGIFENEDYVSFVDAVVSKLFGSISVRAMTLLTERKMLRGDRTDQVSDIAKSFYNDQPYHAPESIADIVEAGWQIYLEAKKFVGKFDDLSNLVLKTIEIYEFNSRGRNLGSGP